MNDLYAPIAPPTTKQQFHYIHSVSLAQLIEQLGISLFVSTYQAGKLMVVRARGGRLSTLLRDFEQMMGLALEPHRLAVGTRNQIWFLRNAPDIAAQVEPKGEHNACFLPQSARVTGDIRVHEMAWVGDELWIVNTRFSCLCTLHPQYSFMPRWKPPFITALRPEDRCHVNGMALVNGQPKFVTALGATDVPQGWRENKAKGGILMDIPSGEIVARGFAMPHSPRVYEGRVWILDSGTGRLLVIDPQVGRYETVAELPGFTRGLAIYGDYAFVGLSQIREKQTFGGLPIEQRVKQLKCGVYAVNIRTGQIVGFLEFQSGCTELFDVQVLPNIRWPAILGFQQVAINNTFILPPVITGQVPNP